MVTPTGFILFKMQLISVCVDLKGNTQEHIHRPALSDTLLKYVDELFST